MTEVFALIPARGGSKGVPHKNTKLMAGKPMMVWTIEAALKSRHVSRTFVSTEDAAIAAVARAAGAEVPFIRPANLATDTASTFAVVLHFCDWLKANGSLPGRIMVLQPTSPLRTPADIDGAIELAEARQAKSVVGVCELHPHMAHPWYARRIVSEGTLRYYLAGNVAGGRRQDMPTAHIINGAIYLYRTADLPTLGGAIPHDALPYVMPVERSVDVDTAWDFRIAELVLENGL